MIPIWLVLLAVFVVAALVCFWNADGGGSHVMDFPDVFTGCVLPVFLVMAGVIVALFSATVWGWW